MSREAEPEAVREARRGEVARIPSATMKIAPSILASDFAHLAAEVERVSAAVDLLHVDCMDGHYVPNLSIGPPVVASLRRCTDLYLDCHLMCSEPATLLAAFADAGADGVTVHVELGDPRPLLDEIRGLGMRAGLTFEPTTPFAAVEPYLEEIDTLLVMSVRTGFGGQSFIPEVLDKLVEARRAIDARGLPVEIEIDGGIKVATARLAAEAGADILVAGTAIFGAEDSAAAARSIREAAWGS